uniref:Uncharacterized protein n=1 Tax=Caenorhabditis tropicalis TaxID=1561998 RepID=A0A1I7UIG9_9PELO
MCITKKATKTQQDKPKEDEGKKKKPAAKKKKFSMFPRKKSDEVAQDPPKVEEPNAQSQNKSVVKEEEVQNEVEQAPAEVEVKKDPPKRPIINRPNCVNLAGLSAAQKKKTNKYKYGQIDREELSINNDKTEYLENAQLTKLMSHADVKALMGGQQAQGENGDDPNCQDTVEEVDDEMQDIAFSPLLATIPPEDNKELGGIARPAD